MIFDDDTIEFEPKRRRIMAKQSTDTDSTLSSYSSIISDDTTVATAAHLPAHSQHTVAYPNGLPSLQCIATEQRASMNRSIPMAIPMPIPLPIAAANDITSVAEKKSSVGLKLKLKLKLKLTFKNKRGSNRESTSTDGISSASSVSSVVSTQVSTQVTIRPPIRQPTLTDFERPILDNPESKSTRTRVRLSQWRCRYVFGDGWSLQMDKPMGRSKTEVKEAIRILSQQLTPIRVKESLNSDKKVYLSWIRNANSEMCAASVFHIDELQKRVRIEMLAVDKQYRYKGLAEMMVRCIQYRMKNPYRLQVNSAIASLPFWTKTRFQFRKIDVTRLNECEMMEERKGDVLHLEWEGNNYYSGQQLLNLLCRWKNSDTTTVK